MLQSIDKQMPFTVAWQNTTTKNQVSVFINFTKVPSIFNTESVGWNLNKQMLLGL